MGIEKLWSALLSKGKSRTMGDDIIKSAAELAAERAAQTAREEAPDASNQTSGSNEPEAQASPGTAELQQRIASLGEELEAVKDKNVRLVAEFDNFRKRSAREYAETQDAAQGKAFSALFPVIDNFERAFQDAPAGGDWVPQDPAGFAKGMRLIRDSLRQILADAGVEEIPAEGAPFDPNIHDALTQMPHPAVPADHVATVHARGWKKGDKILRHAQVIVSAGPAT